jgi:hypothetical protein
VTGQGRTQLRPRVDRCEHCGCPTDIDNPKLREYNTAALHQAAYDLATALERADEAEAELETLRPGNGGVRAPHTLTARTPPPSDVATDNLGSAPEYRDLGVTSPLTNPLPPPPLPRQRYDGEDIEWRPPRMSKLRRSVVAAGVAFSIAVLVWQVTNDDPPVARSAFPAEPAAAAPPEAVTELGAPLEASPIPTVGGGSEPALPSLPASGPSHAQVTSDASPARSGSLAPAPPTTLPRPSGVPSPPPHPVATHGGGPSPQPTESPQDRPDDTEGPPSNPVGAPTETPTGEPSETPTAVPTEPTEASTSLETDTARVP